MKNKTICILLLIFFSVESFAQSEKRTSEFILRTDLFSPLRGNSTASLILDYSPSDSSRIVHSFGVEVVYDYLFMRNEEFPSIPTIDATMPSGAVFYTWNKRIFKDAPAYFGVQALVGNYKYRYSRYVCLDSEEVPDANFCKCKNFTKNEFEYQNLKFSLAANFGTRGSIGRIFIGTNMRLGGYYILPRGERIFIDDVINCSNIGDGGLFVPPLLEDEEKAITHNTPTLDDKSKFGFMGQVSVYVGFKF